jgi:hypothetical protein
LTVIEKGLKENYCCLQQNLWGLGAIKTGRVVGGAEGDRTPGLRIANGKNGLFIDHILVYENPPFSPKTLTKTQPRTRNRLV